MIKLVSFDVDGVLLDSLPPHLQYCEDIAKRLGLTEYNCPSPEEFRKIAKLRKVGPMDNFFRAIGFPENLVSPAFDAYKKEFASYKINVFPEINNLLTTLNLRGIQLGLVTANTLRNVKSALGELFLNFNQNYIRTLENPGKKSDHIRDIIKISSINPNEMAFVGDTSSDRVAAEESGVSFIHAAYGGFEFDDSSKGKNVILAKSPRNLLEIITQISCC